MGQKQIQEFNMILYYDILKYFSENSRKIIKVKNIDFLHGIKHEIETEARIITISYSCDGETNGVFVNIGGTVPPVKFIFEFYNLKMLQQILYDRWL